eukprot:CAMPEP_0170074120 /NCGR_PEP_ID=MMETSP0019_2-20121128/11463_1 /TAXON_ID=98059 /ORGANISM="Dinobryon sp., Strain UTEXLB2267" /LENGTH=212 /DNA_ID=CAMNT_0010284183 /DNA_START=399 /DNA_END=1037 /DNA_ORIENTATION=+
MTPTAPPKRKSKNHPTASPSKSKRPSKRKTIAPTSPPSSSSYNNHPTVKPSSDSSKSQTIAPSSPASSPYNNQPTVEPSSVSSKKQCFSLIDPSLPPNSDSNSKMVVNGNTTYTAVVTAGQVAYVTYSYSWHFGGYCPGCVVQIYAGFVGTAGTCPINGFTSSLGYTPNPYPIEFSMQLNEGCHLVFATITLDFFCRTVTEGTVVGAIWAGP